MAVARCGTELLGALGGGHAAHAAARSAGSNWLTGVGCVAEDVSGGLRGLGSGDDKRARSVAVERRLGLRLPPVGEPGAGLVYRVPAEHTLPRVRERIAPLCVARRLALASLPLYVITTASLRLDDLGPDRLVAAASPVCTRACSSLIRSSASTAATRTTPATSRRSSDSCAPARCHQLGRLVLATTSPREGSSFVLGCRGDGMASCRHG